MYCPSIESLLKGGLITLVFLFIHTFSSSQSIQLRDGIEGYYEGAAIDSNSVALMTAEFYYRNDSLFVKSNVKEWAYYRDFESHVTVEDNELRFKSYYGKAKLYFDTGYSEMAGYTTFPDYGYRMHFKKVRKPISIPVKASDFKVDAGDIKLGGKLFLPKYPAKPACLIYVHGRGCGTLQSLENRARIIAGYGIATVVFDKRGSEPTKFDCEENSFELNRQDLVKVIKSVSEMQEIDKDRIGLIGYSFGGWLAPAAAAKSEVPVDFMITVVGPSTSIKEQQLDNAVYFVKEKFGDKPLIVERIQTYTLLEYDDSNDKRNFKKMMKMLESAEEEGWKNVLEPTDIPKSPEDMKKLWIRRNRYDPREDLMNFKGPFMSLLGETDWVVPTEINVNRFKDIFEAAGKKNYKVVIIPNTPHWFEHGDIARKLKTKDGNYTYMKFDRVVPGAMNEILEFLREYQYID